MSNAYTESLFYYTVFPTKYIKTIFDNTFIINCHRCNFFDTRYFGASKKVFVTYKCLKKYHNWNKEYFLLHKLKILTLKIQQI